MIDIKKPTKEFFLLAILLLIFFAVYFFFKAHSTALITSDTPSSYEESVKPISETFIRASHDSDSEKNEISQLAVDNQNNSLYGVRRDKAAMAEIGKWFAARGDYGLYGVDQQSDYLAYDESTLEKLSKAGDIHAMHILAIKVGNLPAKKFFLQRASVYGSTAALRQIGSMIETEEHFDERPKEEIKPYVMESLAYYDAAKLRGDQWAEINEKDSLLHRYPTNLTQQDSENIQKRAKAIYDDLQEERNLLGLGEFDNSVPDSVNRFYAEIKKSISK